MSGTLSFEHYPVDALMRITTRPKAVFVRGQGSWLWDSTGRRYLDCVQGWAVNTLGHAAPAIAQALVRQSTQLLHVGPGLYNDQAIALAERLVELSGLQRVFFTNSGAEANEGAIKLARKWGQLHRGGASTIISFGDSFHGRTLATMAASGKPGFDALFAPAVPGFVKVPYNDLPAVAAAIRPDTVAVMLELVQGEAGVIEADQSFVTGLRTLCDRHGLLLIVDEVQTGIGRCGSLFAHTQYGLRPDIMTLGKGLGGGVPIGALMASDAVSCFQPGDQGGTYNGNALVCAVGLAVLQAVTEPGFLDDVNARSRQLRAGLVETARRHGLSAVRGRGLLLATELAQPNSAALVDRLREPIAGDAPGLLVNPVRPQRLRWMPALNISADEVDQALDLFDAGLASIAAAH
jgi:acetylornithine/N-succinyldiaminopimelate aminotransferase